ncbi:MAG: alpha/beta hydrolase [Rhodocyclaceae bacterium]|nr:alpha/beta hydrolase [Rhodocyclaceae bacterium]
MSSRLPELGDALQLRSWYDYLRQAEATMARFAGHYVLAHFEYEHPPRLQPGTPRRMRKPYRIRVSYAAWGEPSNPTLICCGGVVNSAMRFAWLADALRHGYHVICLDWVGRGNSGWLFDEADYSLETHVEQVRQLIAHLGDQPVKLLGSSLGGSVGIELAARWPRLVERLILNDIGPFIPKSRRLRRAQALARHYVFREPADLLRKIGAAQRNFGPAGDEVRFHLSYHQTRWSESDGGRIYRHDVRALQAYRRDAVHSLDQWGAWARVRCPVLVIHGMLSDALLPGTIGRMCKKTGLQVMHVPDTGHTPILYDDNQIHFVRSWLDRSALAQGCWCVLHAPLIG